MADHTVMVAPVTDPETFARFRATFLEQQAGAPEIIPPLPSASPPGCPRPIAPWRSYLRRRF